MSCSLAQLKRLQISGLRRTKLSDNPLMFSLQSYSVATLDRVFRCCRVTHRKKGGPGSLGLDIVDPSLFMKNHLERYDFQRLLLTLFAVLVFFLV